MFSFWALACLFVTVAVLFVIYPFWRNSEESGADDIVESHRQLNVTLYKTRLDELQANLDLGQLTADEFESLKLELQRSLLSDTDTQDGAPLKGVRGQWVMWVALLALPLASFALYDRLGSIDDVELVDHIGELYNPDSNYDQAKIEVLVDKLEARLEKQSDLDDYRFLLGRLQLDLSRPKAAAENFWVLHQNYPKDPELLARYGQAKYMAANGVITNEVSVVFDQVLAMNPQQEVTLSILGMNHYQQGDFSAAIDAWQALLRNYQPKSQMAVMLQQSIYQAQQQLLNSGSKTVATTPDTTPAAASVLDVSVSLGDGVVLPEDGVVFVFAKAVSGPPAPLAVAKLSLSDLPARVRLDDSLAMAPNLTLSKFENVYVSARLSVTGSVARSAGDVEGRTENLVLKEGTVAVNVIMDTVID